MYAVTYSGGMYTHSFTPHTHDVVSYKVTATCTSAGQTEEKYCSSCGKVLQAGSYIPALGHNEVTFGSTAATCTTAGKTSGTKCLRCGVVLSGGKTIPATGHTEKKLEAVAATYDATGLT